MFVKLGIFNEFMGLENNYINACEELDIEYEVIDIISSDWIENIRKSNCDGYLARPSYKKDAWKRMYDERLYYIQYITDKPVYPVYKDIFLHESKKNMAYWLQTHDLPHPKTWVFYNKDEAMDFIENKACFPLVFKPNIGSYSMGVKYISRKHQAKRLINKVFTKYGFYNSGYAKWQKTKFGLSVPLMDDKQSNYITFQEMIDVKHEWRMIKIGKSYFGHQKMKKGKFHSGSGKVGWVAPPEQLLQMTQHICSQGNFSSMNIDIFEDLHGDYYVNELQPFFGAYNDSQMYIDGKPGRYLSENGSWVFEEGYFCQNACCNLRVLDFVEQLEESLSEEVNSESLT